jgi:hypothetical protein
MPDRLFSTNEFASALRDLYPQFQGISDDELTHAVVATHPQFKGKVVDILEGADGVTLPTGVKYGPPPAAVNLAEFPQIAPDQTPMTRLASGRTGGRVATSVGEARDAARRQDDSVAGQIFASPVVGALEMGSGVKDMATGTSDRSTTYPRLAGANKVASGAMRAALPLIPEALFSAPLAAGVGLAGGIGADWAARQGLQQTTLDPEVQNALAIGSGIVAGGLGGAAGHGLSGEMAARRALNTAAEQAKSTVTREPFQYLDTVAEHVGPPPQVTTAPVVGGGTQSVPPAPGMVRLYRSQNRWFTSDPGGEQSLGFVDLPTEHPLVQQLLQRGDLDAPFDATGQSLTDLASAPEPLPYAGLLPPARLFSRPPTMDMPWYDYLDTVVTPQGIEPAVNGIPASRMLAAPAPFEPPPPADTAGLVDAVADAVPGALETPGEPRLVRPEGWERQLSLTPPPAVEEPLATPGTLPFRQTRAKFPNEPIEALEPGGAPDTADQGRLHLRELVDQERDPRILNEVQTILDELRTGPRPAFEDFAEGPATDPTALFKIIAKHGGIGLDDAYKGELDRLWENGVDTQKKTKPRAWKNIDPLKDTLRKTPDNGRRVGAALAGIPNVLRNEPLETGTIAPRGAKSLDHMAEILRGEPEGAFAHIDGPNALLDAIEQGLVAVRQREAGAARRTTEAADHAPVFWDIAKEGPASVPSRGAIERGLVDFLNGKRTIWGARAYKVARERLESRGAFEDWRNQTEGGFGPPPELAQQEALPLSETGDVPTWMDEDLPPNTGTTVANDADLPDFLRDLQPEHTTGGWDEEGTVTLYRGEAAPGTGAGIPAWVKADPRYQQVQHEASGRWFTDNPDTAQWYANEAGNGQVRQVEVSRADAERYRAEHDPTAARYSRDTGEYFLPREIADRAALPGEAQPDLPGTEGVRQQEQATPQFEAPFSLSSEVSDSGAPTARPGLFDRLKGEEGVLILNVKPSNRRGLRDWLDRHEEEYGQEDWFQQARSAWEAGDTGTAWRVAALASARAMGGEAASSFNREKAQADAEAQLGGPLPKGVTVGEGGVLKMPSNPGGLDVKLSDLTLGKNIVSSLIEHADPTTILRVADESGKVPRDLPHELRITAQIADQMLRDWPQEALDDLGIATDMTPVQLAAQFDRAFSNAGKVLNVAKQWQDRVWDDLLHLDPALGSTRGPGAAGRLEFFPAKTREAFLTWLQDHPNDWGDVGFSLPKGVELDTPQGKARARAFFGKAKALEELGTTFDRLTTQSNALDKAMVWSALNKREQNAAIFNALENTSRAFLISKPTTAIRNTWSQSGRYLVGVADELVSGAAATMLLDPTEAGLHFRRAAELGKSALSTSNHTVPVGLRKDFGAESLQALYDYSAESVAGMEPTDARKFLWILDQFPRQAARFVGSLSLEENSPKVAEGLTSKAMQWLTNPRFRNMITVANRLQEYSFRTTVFDAMMREQIRSRGGDPTELLAGHPKALIDQFGTEEVDRMIGTAVSAALDYTFAANPLPNTVQSKVLEIFNNIPFVSPFLRMGMPFPRFNWVSAPRFLYDHSPMALLDIPGLAFGMGRLSRGMELKALDTRIIPDVVREIAEAKFTREKHYQDFLTNQVEAAQARKTWRALEKKAETQGSLQGMEGELHELSQTVHDRLTKAAEARAIFKEAESRVKRLDKQRTDGEKRSQQLREIGAPSPAEFLGRQAIGMGVMLPLAYMLRASDGAKDTKWYEYRVTPPGTDHAVTLDFRPFGPFVQYLLLGDLLHDMWTHTDWEGYHASDKNPAAALAEHYQGKYTSKTAGQEIASAFLSISPAAGSTAAIIDYLTGRTGSGTSAIEDVAGGILGMVGQFLGRFTVPLQTINDARAIVDDDAKAARVPEENTPEDFHATDLLLGPAAANIPFVREQTIKTKTSPLTGGPTETEMPTLRLGAGFNAHTQGLLERALAHTGLEYGKAVPRKTGDREFDNQVASVYGGLVNEVLPETYNDEEFQQMNPELQRDVLQGILSQLRRAAFGQVLSTLDDDAALQKREAPAARAKRERWQRYAEQGVTSEPEPATTSATDGQPEAPPAGPGGPATGFGPPPSAQLP